MHTAPSQEKMLLQLHHEPPCPPPGFVEITHTLWWEGSRDSHLLSTVISILAKEAKDQDQYEVMGSSIMSAHLFRHPTLGHMYIDLLTCMMSVMDLGSGSIVGDHHPLLCQRCPIWTDHTSHCLATIHPPVVLDSFPIQHVCHNVLIDRSCHISVQ